MKPPAAGPTMKPISQDIEESAMYRPRSCGGARSATSAPCVGPWKHSPTAKTTIATPRRSANNALEGVGTAEISQRWDACAHDRFRHFPSTGSVPFFDWGSQNW